MLCDKHARAKIAQPGDNEEGRWSPRSGHHPLVMGVVQLSGLGSTFSAAAARIGAPGKLPRFSVLDGKVGKLFADTMTERHVANAT